MRHGAFLALLVLPGMVSAAPLSDTERKIALAVDAHREASLALLESAVSTSTAAP